MDEELQKKFDDITEKANTASVSRIITKLVVRHSVSAIIVTAVHTYVPTYDKKQKLQLYVGAWAMGGVVSEHASRWAATKVEDYLDIAKTALSVIKKSPESSKEDHHIQPSQQTVPPEDLVE